MRYHKPLILFNMTRTVIKYLPTGTIYDNRKEAKRKIGHSRYNNAVKNGDVVFVTAHGLGSIII